MTNRASTRRIIADQGHIVLLDAVSGRTLWQIEWADVAEVAGWKEDLVIYDMTCIGFRPRGGETFHVCNEEDQGWDDLLAILERVLGVRSDDWWSRVALPAFQRNWTILWQPAG